MKKGGWLPTRLNCIVDAPAHRISMRLFLTIALLSSLANESFCLARARARFPSATPLARHPSSRHPASAAPFCPVTRKVWHQLAESLSCHGAISESQIPDVPCRPPPERLPTEAGAGGGWRATFRVDDYLFLRSVLFFSLPLSQQRRGWNSDADGNKRFRNNICCLCRLQIHRRPPRGGIAGAQGVSGGAYAALLHRNQNVETRAPLEYQLNWISRALPESARGADQIFFFFLPRT